MKRDECSDQEQWVLERVEQGKIADLKEKFGQSEENRHLSSNFLEALLTDEIADFKPTRKGIRIARAGVAEALDLENAEVAHIVSLFDCVFKEPVNFGDASFQKHLFMDACRFGKHANFQLAKVTGNLFCRGAVFEGPVDFGGVYIGGQFSAQGAHFNGKGQNNEANFNGLKVGHKALFDRAVFQGPVNFVTADIKGQFSAQWAHFNGKGQNNEANFNSLKVGQTALFCGAQFHGPVDFGNICVKEHFDIRPLQKPEDVRRQPTVFKSLVDFNGAYIGGQFGAMEAQFASKEDIANFNGLKVGKSAFFKGAEFCGPVNFTLAEIKRSFDVTPLDEHDRTILTIFHGEVLFSGASISMQFLAHHVRFLSKDKGTMLNGLKVGRNAVFDEAIFLGPVDFLNAQIDGQFSADGAQFQGQGKEKNANFNGLKVGQDAFFNQTFFQGPVDFGGAEIGCHFNANGAQFQGQGHDNEANFNGLRVGQIAFFGSAVFQGPVDFALANIGGQFNADGAQFQGQGHDNEANFNSMKVGQIAFFCGTHFHGPVDFSNIRVGEHFDLRQLKKTEDDRPQPTMFKSFVDFGGADIGGEFNADGAQFQGQGHDNEANFNSMKVGQSAFFCGTHFHGPVDFFNIRVGEHFDIRPLQIADERLQPTLFKSLVDFGGAHIGGQLCADGAQFQSQEKTVFEGLRVGASALFAGTGFASPVALNDAHLLDLLMGGRPIPELDLERTRIDRELRIKETQVGKVSVRNLIVQGPTTLDRVTFKDEADLRDASFQQLNIVDVKWPEWQDGKARLWLDGLRFQAISTKKEPGQEEEWERVQNWLSLARFNTQNYRQVEEYFQRSGMADWAYRVFLDARRRRWRRRPWWSLGKWATLLFWDWLAGYGRKPFRVLWVSFVIILMGALILNPAQVLVPEMLQALGLSPDCWLQAILLRVILSLYSFLSAIPGWGGHLELCPPDFFIFVFLWFQRLCGWILIPIGLAAIYTRIRA